MPPPTPTRNPDVPRTGNLSATGAFAFISLPVIAGLCTAALLHFTLIMPRIGVGSPDLNRAVQLGHHLDSSPYATGTWAVAVGDSVTVEGFDAAIARAHAAPGWSVQNIGLNGCDRGQIRVVLPKVLTARPTAAIFILRPRSIAEPIAVTHDGAFAYVLGGFPNDFPRDWITGPLPGLSRDVADDLSRPVLTAKLHFRTAIATSINDGLRERLRRGIKFSRPDDWTAPFNLSTSIDGATLDRHLATLERETVDATTPVGSPPREQGAPFTPDTAIHEDEMRRLILMTRDAGVTPIIVIAPVHPRMRTAPVHSAVAARLREIAPGWASESGGVYADASLLLDESGFADGQHLNAHGRELLSAFVGERLPAPRPDTPNN